MPATDERISGTIDAISRELDRDGFPQAFSHLTLILAARAISAAEADAMPAGA